MAKPVSPEDAENGRWLAEWRARYPEAHGFELEWDEELGVPVPTTRRESMTRCNVRMRSGSLCQRYAGQYTAHQGVGACWRHDTRVERAAGAWAVAHRIAQVMDVSPWEALLTAVRRAAAWATFYDSKLAEVTEDDELRPGGSAHEWVEAAERVNDKLARWSKMAVDAGVAKLLVERAQAEGATIARVLNDALGRVGLDEDTERRVRLALREALVAEGERERLTAGPHSETDSSVSDDVGDGHSTA